MALVLPKSLFIHVPKTGGTWVRAAIRAAGIHAEESGPFDVHDHYGVFDLPLFLTSRFSFGFARHPVEWLKSRWAWAVLSGFPKKLPREPAAAGHWMAGCWSDRFEEFIAAYLDTCPGIATATCLGMLGWIRRGKVWEATPHAVDYIGRTERLAEDLQWAFSLAGEDYDRKALLATAPQRVGARGPLETACHLSAALRQRVLGAELGICKVMGYS